MEKPVEQSQPDIADEPYRGPGRVVVAAGEGFLAHYGLAITSGVIVGLITAAFHKPTARLLGVMRDGARQMTEIQGEGFGAGLKRGVGGLGRFLIGHGTEELHYLREAKIAKTPHHQEILDKALHSREHGFGYWLLDHTVGLMVPPLSKYVRGKGPRVQDSIAAGGLVGGLAFIFSPIYFAFSGARNADAGRQQFERAKEHLITTRAENEALREKYVKTRLELEDLKTIRAVESGQLHVTKDQPTMRRAAPATPGQAEAMADSPAEITPPTVKEAEIGPAPATGHALNREGKESWAETLAARETEQAQQELTRA